MRGKGHDERLGGLGGGWEGHVGIIGLETQIETTVDSHRIEDKGNYPYIGRLGMARFGVNLVFI